MCSRCHVPTAVFWCLTVHLSKVDLFHNGIGLFLRFGKQLLCFGGKRGKTRETRSLSVFDRFPATSVLRGFVWMSGRIVGRNHRLSSDCFKGEHEPDPQ